MNGRLSYNTYSNYKTPFADISLGNKYNNALQWNLTGNGLLGPYQSVGGSIGAKELGIGLFNYGTLHTGYIIPAKDGWSKGGFDGDYTIDYGKNHSSAKIFYQPYSGAGLANSYRFNDGGSINTTVSEDWLSLGLYSYNGNGVSLNYSGNEYWTQ